MHQMMTLEEVVDKLNDIDSDFADVLEDAAVRSEEIEYLKEEVARLVARVEELEAGHA